MSSVILHGKEFTRYLEEETIQARIKEMADVLSAEYSEKEPLFVGILNGCFRFASDLMKYMEFNSEINFVKLASYRGMESSGKVTDLIRLNSDIRGRHVVVLEDIVDTGHTLDYLSKNLLDENPASYKVASLLFKEECFVGNRKPDYQGFTIPNLFVVGYGLDYDGLGRNLNDIYQIKT
jgi:hypoxanthine phosphoribosyltransferase